MPTEERLAQYRASHLKHKEKRNTAQKEKHLCKCGRFYTQSNYQVHIKTNIHSQLISERV